LTKENDAWVRTSSYIYEDSIVGDREGLLLLKKSIDEAIQQKSSLPTFNADFKSIICAEEKWTASEESELPKWQTFVFALIVALWLALLPISGIAFVISWFL